MHNNQTSDSDDCPSASCTSQSQRDRDKEKIFYGLQPSTSEGEQQRQEQTIKFGRMRLRANDLVQLGKFDKALDLYDRCLAFDMYDVAALSNRAFVHLQLGMFDKAEEDCDRALQLKPGRAKLLYRRGIARWKRGRIFGGMSDCRAALELLPASVEVREALRGMLGDAKKFVGDENISHVLAQHNIFLGEVDMPEISNNVTSADFEDTRQALGAAEQGFLADIGLIGPCQTKQIFHQTPFDPESLILRDALLGQTREEEEEAREKEKKEGEEMKQIVELINEVKTRMTDTNETGPSARKVPALPDSDFVGHVCVRELKREARRQEGGAGDPRQDLRFSLSTESSRFLKDLCKQFNLHVSGNKTVLLDRLMAGGEDRIAKIRRVLEGRQKELLDRLDQDDSDPPSQSPSRGSSSREPSSFQRIVQEHDTPWTVMNKEDLMEMYDDPYHGPPLVEEHAPVSKRNGKTWRKEKEIGGAQNSIPLIPESEFVRVLGPEKHQQLQSINRVERLPCKCSDRS
ncbi:hypothetical protein GUITHDRAFT_137052 [Guillardia theta CCMP2712]|uniref:SAP domain-containing protein n=1 Tax=Guillardia theta (strain CCMP2712) TaxID=905079 RepID=L1JIX7_GUITC|nr:hypothetical protein GUITHDRAFT_137052 [Guillardia theta CCMP2712]EKX48109.1 hypothetical protein GUITHDRAFT_137052 [Guillardia theta CCMP2712]|eukprot:XP_005835089.1 hypothetical protein GUITHDRAFT_137052 [Guillardia theta CCMP2712]